MEKKESNVAEAVPNREYKDSVFVHLLNYSKINLLEVYNALNNSHLSKETEVEYLNLKKALYSTVKNDVAALIEGKIVVLIEHQSTINENMPLRCFFYSSHIYETLVEVKSRYAKTQVKIPVPEFYVLYNGTEPYPERKTIRLSDAFIMKSEKITLELVVEVININHGQNEEFLKSCKIINEYSLFVFYVRLFYEKDKKEESFKKAIEYCIKHNILKDYLEANMSEVCNFLLAEYDYDTDVAVQRDEAYKVGVEKGREEGRVEGIEVGREEGIEVGRVEGIEVGRVEGMREGVEKGIEKGSHAKAIETARNCIALKMPVATIAKITGLAKEEIERL